MPLKVTEIVAGDMVLGWMKLGFALRKMRRADGTIYRQVPSQPTRFSQDDLQQFTGLVTHNDLVNHILRIEVSRMNRFTMATSQPLMAEMHYSALLRLRKISPLTFSPKGQNPLRPTRDGYGAGFYPYRTQEEVQLVW